MENRASYTPIANLPQVLNNKNDLDKFLSNCHSRMISERSEKKAKVEAKEERREKELEARGERLETAYGIRRAERLEARS